MVIMLISEWSFQCFMLIPQQPLLYGCGGGILYDMVFFNVIAVPALTTSLHAPVRLVVRFGFRLGFGLESGG